MPKDPLQLVDLTTARTEFEAEVIRHALETAGIPAHAFTLAGGALAWYVATAQPIRVQVRRQDLERAQQALSAVRQESVDFDWSELEAEDFDTVCANCGYSLKGVPDPRLCPECGMRRETGGVPAPRTGRMTKASRVAVYTLLVILALPIVFELARMIFGF